GGSAVDDDVGNGFGQAGLVFAADDGSFANGWVSDEGAFNFGGAKPAAVDFEEVVGTAGVPEVAIFVLIILVAGAEPRAVEDGFAALVLIPVPGADGVAFHEQVADFIGPNHLAVFIDDFGFVSRNELAAGARPDFAGAIGDNHLKGFRRAERVENLDAKALLESCK